MWTFEHSVECKVHRDFAWQFWTNVSNWAMVDSSVEWASIDGPFRSGATGSTKSRGGKAVHWRVEDAQPGSGATVLIHVSGAAMRSVWRFEDSEHGRTRITQRASIEGERAEDYAPTFGPQLEREMPAGMLKLAEAMERAAANSSSQHSLGLL
jgi:hypothetical protein